MTAPRVCMLLHKSVVHDSRVRREAASLAETGHRVTVLELDRAAGGRLDGFERASVAPPPWVRRVLPFQLYRVVFLVAFVRAIVRLRPDVVHAHDAAMLLPGVIGARLTGARLVYDSHELATGVEYRDGRWAAFVGWVERVGVPRADAVITVTEGIAERLRERYGLGETPAVVRNLCALEARPPDGSLRAALGIGDAPLVLHQGAAAPGRGCETLVAAMERLPGVRLAFLGDGEPGFDERLAALAGERGVGDRVHFHPSVPLESLLARTAEADVGVSLLQATCENHRLALPNKLFEYVAAGVPVVASDLPEIRRTFAPLGVAWLVDPGSPEAVAGALREALAARPGMDAARAALSWAAERERLRAVYARLTQPVDAVVLVRNGVSHDARVLRAARALTASGRRPLVVGVVAGAQARGPDRVGGVEVLRLAPGLRLGRPRAAPGAGGAVPPAAGATATGGALPPVGGAAAGARAPGLARRLHRLLTTADYYRRGIALMLRLRPALVHANDHNTMWIGIAAKWLTGARLVYDAHELWPDRNGRWEWRPWLLASEALFMRAADRVITASPGYAERMAARYRVPAPAVVRNVPADRDGAAAAAQPAPPPLDGGAAATTTAPPQGDALVYVGGLMPGRGLEQAIDALALVPDARLRLIGPGAPAFAAGLRRRAEERGVAGRVELLPPVPPDEVPAAIAGAGVGLSLIQPVCASYELTLPNKLFEYLAARVPVLTSDVPVSAAFVRRHGIGEVVPAGDVEAIAAAIGRLLDPERLPALRGRLDAVAAEVTWEGERRVLLDAYGDGAA